MYKRNVAIAERARKTIKELHWITLDYLIVIFDYSINFENNVKAIGVSTLLCYFGREYADSILRNQENDVF